MIEGQLFNKTRSLFPTAQRAMAADALFDEVFSWLTTGWGEKTAETPSTMLVKNPEVILFDVRTEGKLAEKGVIEYANWTHIPLERFIEQKSDWPTGKDAKIVVYCGCGQCSTIAMTIPSSMVIQT